MISEKERIEELLHHFRMEQKDFAEKCGFLPDTISNIKLGRCSISKTVFRKIIKAFPDINKSWLLDGEGEMLKNNQSIKEVEAKGHFVNSPVANNVRNDPSIIEGLMRAMEKKDEQMDRLLSIIEQLNNK